MNTDVQPDRVAIYIRWSTDDQALGTTLAVQREGCRHYVLSQGWQVNPDLEFVDDGWSGGTLDRPGLNRLRTAVQAGLVDCVVVFKLDRLSRSVVDTVKLVLEEWDGQTVVKSAREPIDTGTPTGKILFYILASYAEWERSVIRERTHAGQLSRVRQGRVAGFPAPYGYRRGPVPGTLEAVAEEAAVVRRIFSAYAAGAGAGALARRLNQEGIPFRRGRPWSERTLLYLLGNSLYCGDLVYGRTSPNPRHGKHPAERLRLRHARPAVEVPDSPHVPPLVTRAEFAAAQRARAARAGGQRGQPSGRVLAAPHLLTGIGRCGRCGSSLYVKTSRKGARVYTTYACLGKKGRRCDAANVPREWLDAQVGEGVRRRHAHRLDLVAAGRRRAQALAVPVAAAAAEVARLDREAARVMQDYRAGRLSPETYMAVAAAVAAERAAAAGRQAAAAARQQARERAGAPVAGTGGADPWAVLAPTARKQVLLALARTVTLYRAPGGDQVELTVTWHGAGPAAGETTNRPGP